MPRTTKQGAITAIEYEDGRVVITIDTFAISISAVHTQGNESHIDHKALAAPSHITTEDEAQKYGFEEARKEWPETEGWKLNVRVSKTPYTFNLTSHPET